MAQHASVRRVRFQLEHLEPRCTPSTLLGGPSTHALASQNGPPLPPAAVAAHRLAVPIRLTAHLTSDGTGAVNLTGLGSQLGRWTAHGAIDSVVNDTAANRIAIRGTATVIAQNRQRLFVTFSVSLNPDTGRGEETLTFTGGTGRFAGVSGGASLDCVVTWDPASPLTFQGYCKGTGTLVFPRSR